MQSQGNSMNEDLDSVVTQCPYATNETMFYGAKPFRRRREEVARRGSPPKNDADGNEISQSGGKENKASHSPQKKGRESHNNDDGRVREHNDKKEARKKSSSGQSAKKRKKPDVGQEEVEISDNEYSSYSAESKSTPRKETVRKARSLRLTVTGQAPPPFAAAAASPAKTNARPIHSKKKSKLNSFESFKSCSCKGGCSDCVDVPKSNKSVPKNRSNKKRKSANDDEEYSSGGEGIGKEAADARRSNVARSNPKRRKANPKAGESGSIVSLKEPCDQFERIEDELELDYDWDVDNDHLINEDDKSSKKKKKPKHIIGEDVAIWNKKVDKAVAESKARVAKKFGHSRYDFVFDAMNACGLPPKMITAMADILMEDVEALCGYKQSILTLCNEIANSGMSFSVPGDIMSPLVFPAKPEDVARGIVRRDKKFRRTCGERIGKAEGRKDAANLGQPLNMVAVLCVLQHWAVLGHKALGSCPFDKIDWSPCNTEIRKVIGKWLLADFMGTWYYDDRAQLPDNFDERVRLSDLITITIDKKKVKKNSRAKKPPTDVDGQVDSFLGKAEIDKVTMALLPMLYNTLRCIVTKMNGNHMSVLTMSYESYRFNDYSPRRYNPLANVEGGIVHAQNLVAAGKQLRKTADWQLIHMEQILVRSFMRALGIASPFGTNILQKRSGRMNMTEAEKQLLAEQENPLVMWAKNASAKELSDRAKKGAETLGKSGLSDRSKKAMKTLGKSGLSDRSKRALKTMGKSGLSDRAKKGAETLGKSGRSDRAKKGAETLGKSGRSDRARNTAETKMKKNPMYNHFTKIESGWSCNYCSSVIKSNTSLRKHLLACKSCPLEVKNILKTTSLCKRRS